MVGPKIVIKLSILCLILGASSSCSLFNSKRSVLGTNKKEKTVLNHVSKQQYDELLEKYQALLRRNRQLEGEDLPQEVVNRPKSLPKLAETVDVFAKQLENIPKSKPVTAEVMTAQTQFDHNGVEGQIKEIKKVIRLISSSHFDEALQILKSLESSRHKQILVRVKFYMGEILFRQGEYDLAMQIFEEVLNRYSFSGIVLKTLGRLVVCSEKLKIKKKYDLYYSILHDFFKTA